MTGADPDFVGLVETLLSRSPAQRVGFCGSQGANYLKQQPYFKSANWKGILTKNAAAPIVPPPPQHSTSTKKDELDFYKGPFAVEPVSCGCCATG